MRKRDPGGGERIGAAKQINVRRKKKVKVLGGELEPDKYSLVFIVLIMESQSS